MRQSLHLLHVGETDYIQDEGSTIHDDIDRLGTPDDGHMDEVLDLRARVGADLVTLVGTSGGGIGWFHDGFSVITWGDSGGFLLAHELGHNMGLHHDRHLSGGYKHKAYPYAHGYVNQAMFEVGASEGQRWITIMAYSYQCSDHGLYCGKIMRFSNPDQMYLGDAFGIPGDAETYALDGPVDARRALTNMRPTVAGYQDTRPVLGIADISASGVALEEEQAFTLRAEIHNRGRLASAAWTVRYYRSTDAIISPEDVEVGESGGDPRANSPSLRISGGTTG